MRSMTIAFAIAIFALLALAPSGRAAVAPKPALPSIGNILPVAEGCGYGWHWVDGYRDREGRWIPGHCVRNG